LNVSVPPAPAGIPDSVAVSEIEPPTCALVATVVSVGVMSEMQFAPLVTSNALVSIELSPLPSTVISPTLFGFWNLASFSSPPPWTS